MGVLLCKAVLSLYVECLGVNLLHIFIYVLQYTTARLQVLFSLHHLGRITKVLK